MRLGLAAAIAGAFDVAALITVVMALRYRHSPAGNGWSAARMPLTLGALFATCAFGIVLIRVILDHWPGSAWQIDRQRRDAER